MSELASGSSTQPSVHDLLLALAGRLDDDLLGWARELAAVGEPDQAVELATAALAAERVVLPPSLRSALVAAARAARTDLNVERALPAAAAEDGTPHRFDPDAAPGEAVAAALTGLPGRRLAGCTLYLTWRRTAAGAAPGPLPRAVVLVEADPDRSADVLTYLLGTELERAGAPASVEVFTAGNPLPAYHVAALQTAREIARGAAPPDTSAARDDPPVADAPAVPDVPAPTDDQASRSDPPVRPWLDAAPLRVVPPPAGGEALPERAEDPAGVPPGSPSDPLGSPAAESDPLEHDPLNDPLRVPLMAPLLEPRRPPAAEPSTPEEAPVEPGSVDAQPAELPDEWADDWRSGDWAMPPTGRPDPPVDRPVADDEPTGPEAPSPTRRGAPPGAGRDLPFRRGTVARRPGPPRAEPSEGSLFDSPTSGVGAVLPAPLPGAARPAVPEPSRSHADDPLFGPMREVPLFAAEPVGGRRRRTEPDESAAGTPPLDAGLSGQLSGTERDLLAQLQAELASREGRARPYRRAGRGSSAGVNGHGQGDGPNGDRTPPDLAG